MASMAPHSKTQDENQRSWLAHLLVKKLGPLIACQVYSSWTPQTIRSSSLIAPHMAAYPSKEEHLTSIETLCSTSVSPYRTLLISFLSHLPLPYPFSKSLVSWVSELESGRPNYIQQTEQIPDFQRAYGCEYALQRKDVFLKRHFKTDAQWCSYAGRPSKNGQQYLCGWWHALVPGLQCYIQCLWCPLMCVLSAKAT